MKKGDPKTVRLLAFVAVGAVAFVLIELLPAAGIVKNSLPTGGAAAAEAAPLVAAEASVVKDSFSSPIIALTAEMTGESNTRQAAPVGDSPNRGGFAPIQIGGPLPKVENSTGDNAKSETPNPPPPAPKKKLLLTGVVKVEEAVAFVAVDDRESRGCRVGEYLEQGVKVLAIEGDRVVVGVRGRRAILVLGQVTEL